MFSLFMKNRYALLQTSDLQYMPASASALLQCCIISKHAILYYYHYPNSKPNLVVYNFIEQKEKNYITLELRIKLFFQTSVKIENF